MSPKQQTSAGARTASLTVKVINEDGTEQAYDLENPSQEQRDHVLKFAPAVALVPRSDTGPKEPLTAEELEAEKSREEELMAAKMADATPALTAEEVGDPTVDPNTVIHQDADDVEDDE